MKLKNKTVGFAVTGSFCTFSKVFPEVEELVKEGAKVMPVMSEISYNTDTRFGKAKEHIERLERITGEKVIATIRDAEPIGPKKLLDVLVVAPCTGNTIAKIANGIVGIPVKPRIKQTTAAIAKTLGFVNNCPKKSLLKFVSAPALVTIIPVDNEIIKDGT